jgi:integrase
MPFKRGAVEAPIEYLDRAELDALLKSIDRSTRLGRRDYALFAFMFNTGARVQEALNVRVADVRFEAPPQVRLLGKGRKARVCPLWPATARLLRDLVAEQSGVRDESASPLVFLNARGGSLKPLRCLGYIDLVNFQGGARNVQLYTLRCHDFHANDQPCEILFSKRAGLRGLNG